MILLILVFSLAIRLVSLNQSLWLDEAINVLAVKNYSLSDLVTKYLIADFHPPGYSVILWFWSHIFGFSELSVRAPSVIFGVLTVYLIFLIESSLRDKKTGLIAAVLLAVNPLHVYYSQEARPYSFACLSAALNIYLFIRILRDKKVGLVPLALSNILLLSSDYLVYLLFVAEFVYFILTKSFSRLKFWTVSLLISALAFSFWVPIFINQLVTGTGTARAVPGWGRVVGSADLKSLGLTYIKFIIGRISFYNKFIYAGIFIPIGTVFFTLVIRFILKSKGLDRLVIIWFCLPILLGFIISFFIPVYSYFRFLFVLPAFVLMVSLGLETLRPKISTTIFLLVTLVELAFTFVYLQNPQFQREDWRGLAEFLQTNNIRQVLFESDGSFSPFSYYNSGNVQPVGGLKKIPAANLDEVIDSHSIELIGKKVYLVNYLVDITDPERLVNQKLNQLGYQVTNTYNFNGVGFVYEYFR